MKKMQFLLLLFLAARSASAQDSYRNIEKYWWYRYRLVNDFMKIGPDCGESIPATIRWRQYADEPKTKYDGLQWGDATQHLGNYINMLAGEQAMLRSNKMSVDRTNMELYYALNAFERLDKNAEEYCEDIDQYYPCKATGNSKYGSKNGFFIRDDVPYYDNQDFGYINFVTLNRKHFNRAGILSTIPVRHIRDAAFSSKVTVPSASAPVQPPSNAPSGTLRMPTEESHDQIVQLFGGMGIATKLLNNSATYNGVQLGEKAARNMFEIIHYIPQGHEMIQEGHNVITKAEWIIRNPTTNNRVIGIGDGRFGKGGEAFTYYCDGAVPSLRRVANGHSVYLHEINDLDNMTHFPGYSQLWQTMQWIGPGSIINGDGFKDVVYANTYAAFADNWRIGVHIGPFIIGVNKTWDKIVTHARKENFCMPHLPLMYRIASGPGTGHGTGFSTMDQPGYEKLFDYAPFCGCHSYHPDDLINYPHNTVLNPTSQQEYGSWWWSSDNLCQDYDRRGGTGNDGDYNNIDYMMLFNLYNLNYTQYIKDYFNCYYLENLSTNYPDAQTGYGRREEKLTLNYLEYLSLINKHQNNAYVTYRGAKVIDLKPGFQAEFGSTVTAYIQDYDCRKDDYHLAYTTRPVKAHGRGTNEDSDTTEVDVPVEYAPDAVPYHVDQIAGDPDWVEPDTTLVPSPEDEQAAFDSLITEVRNSGDTILISQLDSLLPHYDLQPVSMRGTMSGNNRYTNGMSKTVTLYPNPSTGRCTVLLSSPATGDIKVLSLMGELIYERHIDQEQKIFIDLGGQLATGDYIVQIQTDRGREVRKLTIVH